MAAIFNNILSFNGSIQLKRGSKDVLETSEYVPRSGELLVATDTGDIRVGDGSHSWHDLPAPASTQIVNSFDVDVAGMALDAIKGKELHERVSTLEGVVGIDCGEVTAPVNNG